MKKNIFNRGKKTQQIKLSVSETMDRALIELADKLGYTTVPELICNVLERQLVWAAYKKLVTVPPEDVNTIKELYESLTKVS